MLDKYDLTKSVVMSNDMIKSEYYKQPELELTLQQKRLMLFMISKIEPTDTELKSEVIQISDYCELFGINYKGGQNKAALRNSLKSLLEKVFFLPIAPGVERSFRWVEKVYIDHNAGTLSVQLDNSLKDYYIGLKKNYAIFQFGYTVAFTSKYSYTMYEFIKKKHEKKHFFYISVDEAKEIFAYNKYPNFSDFKKNVLDPAVSEINEKTDVNVQIKCLKRGRSYEIIEFYVTPKSGKALLEVDTWKVKALNKHEEVLKDMREEWGEEEELRQKYADPELDAEMYKRGIEELQANMFEEV